MDSKREHKRLQAAGGEGAEIKEVKEGGSEMGKNTRSISAALRILDRSSNTART